MKTNTITLAQPGFTFHWLETLRFENREFPVMLLSTDVFQWVLARFETSQRFVMQPGGFLLWRGPTCNNPDHVRLDKDNALIFQNLKAPPLTITFSGWPEDWGIG